MSHIDDFEKQVLAALEERTFRGKGWVSLPSVDLHTDVPRILRLLEERGCLYRSVINLTPSETDPGWWEILLVLHDEPEGLIPETKLTDYGVEP